MKKAIAVVLTLVALQLLLYSLVFQYTPEYRAHDIKERFREVPNDPNPVFNAIIRLRTSDDKFFCSGSIIDSRYALTAAHCLNWLSKSEKLRIYDQYDNYTGVDAEIVAYNDRNDSGAIRGDFKRFKAVDLEKDRHGFIASNGPFYACGYPYGQKNLYCSYALKVATENFSMRLTGVLIPGMSGGPVFDLQTGKQVGINSAVEGDSIIAYPTIGVLGSLGIQE